MEVKPLCLVSVLLIFSFGVGEARPSRYLVYIVEDYGDFAIVSCWIVTVYSADTDTSGVMAQLTPQSRSDDARRKRSTEMVDETGLTYENGTAEDFLRMFNTFDGNCDGFIDVTEWIKLAPLDQFSTILNSSDTNGDSRITLAELESNPMRIYPEKEFMLMPMNKFEEMESGIDSSQEEDGEGKGRKGTQ